ncbi:MAG: hypothetical protein EKK54_08120 [Neisseriaceae bacterium]|nr:MAG: hypothetical protein EKK54_08120 [Neisseriaceae bacterium]
MEQKLIKSVRIEQLDALIAASEVEFIRVFETSTIAAVRLPNGYTLIGHSACVSSELFNKEIGEQIALDNAKQQLWALEGYQLKTEMFNSGEL